MTIDLALLDVLVAFNLGLASQLHCVGMCGGIVTALSVALPSAARAVPTRLFGLALAYNVGRISSYAVAGVLVGLLAAQVVPVAGTGHRGLRIVAGLILVVSGLSLAGLLPRLSRLEAWGMHLWRHIQPLGRRLLPIDGYRKAYTFGLLWGFLPCALVYSTLLFAATRATPTGAGLVMLAFGAGTLPAMVAATWFSASAPAWLRQAWLRRMAGALLIVAGIAYPLLPLHEHAMHTASAGTPAHHHPH